MKHFTLHDIFYRDIDARYVEKGEYVNAVQKLMNVSKLYVTCPLPGEHLEVNPNSIVGHVLSFDPESFTYECEFDPTDAGSMISEWSEAIHFTGHPVMIYNHHTAEVIVTQIAMVHEYAEPCI